MLLGDYLLHLVIVYIRRQRILSSGGCSNIPY